MSQTKELLNELEVLLEKYHQTYCELNETLQSSCYDPVKIRSAEALTSFYKQIFDTIRQILTTTDCKDLSKAKLE